MTDEQEITAIYDLAPPLSKTGIDRDEIAHWLATWDGPVTVDGENVEIVASGDMAWLTALNNAVLYGWIVKGCCRLKAQCIVVERSGEPRSKPKSQ